MRAFLRTYRIGILMVGLYFGGFAIATVMIQSHTHLVVYQGQHQRALVFPETRTLWLGEASGVILYEEHGQLQCSGYLPPSRMTGAAFLAYHRPLTTEMRKIYYETFPVKNS